MINCLLHVMWGGTGGIILNEGYSCGSSTKRTVIEDNNVSGFYTGIVIRDGYENKNIFEEGHIDIINNIGTNLKVGVGIYKSSYNMGLRNLDILISNNALGLVQGGEEYYISDGLSGIEIR